jgi:ribosomal protein S18 acetylase RimI-like enzyme
MTIRNFDFMKADKDLFAVYQTIYSQTDIEMWFSWNDRLNDTKWSDDCYFLCRDGEKVGGAIIAGGLVMFTFLIPPFCDHCLFWKLVICKAKEITTTSEIIFKGVLASEVNILQNYGVRIWRARQMMCRPTDVLLYILPEDITINTPTQNDIFEIANVLRQSFIGGIAYEMFGEDSIEHIVDGVKQSFERYIGTDTMDQFIVARDKSDSKIIGACIAGINPEMPNLFAGIGDVFVLPEYRGKGIGEAMIKHSITAAYSKTPVMKLHVLINNPATSLYHKLGFIAGTVFTDMKYTV